MPHVRTHCCGYPNRNFTPAPVSSARPYFVAGQDKDGAHEQTVDHPIHLATRRSRRVEGETTRYNGAISNFLQTTTLNGGIGSLASSQMLGRIVELKTLRGGLFVSNGHIKSERCTRILVTVARCRHTLLSELVTS